MIVKKQQQKKTHTNKYYYVLFFIKRIIKIGLKLALQVKREIIFCVTSLDFRNSLISGILNDATKIILFIRQIELDHSI